MFCRVNNYIRQLVLGAFCLAIAETSAWRASAEASNTFRFALLSDTHVGSTTGEEDLRATVRDLNSSTGLSFVLISGDITEYGSHEQFMLAKQLLDGMKLPCHVIPGNHDTKWSESGATDFLRIWGADRFVFEHGGFRFIGMHEGPVMKMADGHWAPQDVRWLKQTLEAMPDQAQPVIFVTHYPIDDGIANWFVVLDLLKKYNTQIVLCGHIHRNGKDVFEGLPGVMARSNLRGAAPQGGYIIVDVQGGTNMTFSEKAPSAPAKAPWHSVPLFKRDFSNAEKKTPRPKFDINQRFPEVKEEWVFDTGYTIASTPALTKDLAIVGDASGVVHALALDSGKVRWEFKTGGAVYSTPDISGDRVIFASTDGVIYALDVRTGRELWRYATPRPIVASPKIQDKWVYIGASDGKFRALDVASGKLAWEYEGVGGFVETRPLIFDGKVIFGAWEQYLYALDARSGKLAWKWKGDKQGALLSPAACWPVAADGKVFIVGPDRKMSAIDARTGETVWRTGQYMVRESIGISQDRKRFYVRAMQDFFYAFATAGKKPEKLWERKADFGYDINSAMLVEDQGEVFYGTKNGLIYALDGATGQILWEHKVGVGVVNTLAPISRSRLVATDFDGRIFMLSTVPAKAL